MKLTRRDLRKIINESINEESLADKIKAKGKDLKNKAVTGVDKLKDKFAGQEGEPEEPEEPEESREEYVKRVLSEYEYHLGASGKLLAKKTAQGVKLDRSFKIVGSLPGNFNIYFRQPNGSDFVVLNSRTIDMLRLGRGIGKDPTDVVHIKEFVIKKFIELDGKPASSVDQTADQDNLQEVLSRGSLYRRRYHGRY